MLIRYEFWLRQLCSPKGSGGPYFHVMHVHDLLLVGGLGFVLTVIKRRFRLFATIFDFLTSSVVAPLGLFKITIRSIPLPLEFGRVFCMALPQFFVTCCDIFQRLGNVYEQLGRISIVFCSPGLEG